MSDWWLICPERMSKEQASSCKLFSPCLNQETAAILVKWQMLLPVIWLGKNALIFRNMGWCVLVSKGNFLLFILACPWHIPCHLFLDFSSWVADLSLYFFLQAINRKEQCFCKNTHRYRDTYAILHVPVPSHSHWTGGSLSWMLYRCNCDRAVKANENPISQKFKVVFFHLEKVTHNYLVSFLCHYSS